MFRYIGIYIMAGISFVWITYTGISHQHGLSTHPGLITSSNSQVPAFPNASPLRKSSTSNPGPAPTDRSTPHGRPPWPLVIFSHGLGGSGTTYRLRLGLRA